MKSMITTFPKQWISFMRGNRCYNILTPTGHESLKIFVTKWIKENKYGVKYLLLLKSGCKYCDRAVSLLQRRNIGYLAVKNPGYYGTKNIKLHSDYLAPVVSITTSSLMYKRAKNLNIALGSMGQTTRDYFVESFMKNYKLLSQKGDNYTTIQYYTNLSQILQQCAKEDNYKLRPYIIGENGHLENGSDTLANQQG